MTPDKRDDTIRICEGGIRLSLTDVAGMLGTTPERIATWVDEELPGWNDHLAEAIADFATREVATIYRKGNPANAEAGGDESASETKESSSGDVRRHPRTKGLDSILRANGWTPEFMQAEWDKAIAALEDGCPATTLGIFVRDGFTWDTLPAHLVPRVVGLADRLRANKERHDAEAAEAEARRRAEADARRHYIDHVEEVLVAKLDAGVELTEDEIADFLDYVPHYLDEEGEDGRWTRSVTTYCRTGDGRFFRVDWQRGLTEMQSDTYYFQPVEVTLHEEERTIPVIRRTWQEVTGETVLWSAGHAPASGDADVEARLVAKLDAGEMLTEDEIGEFLEWLDHYDEDEGDDGRWSRPVTTYCKTRDGRFFRVDWCKGLTEYQEDWYDSQPVEVTLTEEPGESTVIVRTWTEVKARHRHPGIGNPV